MCLLLYSSSPSGVVLCVCMHACTYVYLCAFTHSTTFCSVGLHVSVTLCTCANGCVYLGKSVSGC